ncbi:ABC-type transport auxiliary lipoprotein family protein [Marinimicrobium sp. C6131]|uniref:ABC-type transport auxiliary lipoprotein family protein n=1 Tax=Marinimicrobium sp. C6131 TaxID=3022676 RepID=UPI00223C9DCC|nr:ABC-type transport auxiliary lipoprotein family protein [Marinimicrobium sp. C6131]UZJ44517.1 ABC-type transport auxiliary lipoprotein family protein [Marinimicrobium sp. C6131]
MIPSLSASLIRLTGLIGAAWLMAACSPFPTPKQTPVFDLGPVTATSRTEPAPLTLRVDTPSANRTLDSVRILVKPDPSRLNTYPGGRWSDRAPLLLRDHLVTTLRQNQAFAAVISEQSRVPADLILTSDLRAFYGEYDEGRTVVVIALEAQLIQNQSQQILASERFDVRQPSRSNNLEDVVDAFGAAAQTLSTEMIKWAREQGGRHQP